MLPKKLYNFVGYYDGNPMAATIEEITLPTLERALEEYRGGGMLGPVKLDLGLNAMTLEFIMAEFSKPVLKTWGLKGASAVGFRFLGAAMADDETNNDAIEVSVRGRLGKLEPGSAKPGDMTKPKATLELAYFKYAVNGEGLVEIDMINGKEVVGGVDRSGDMLKALGMVQ